MTIMCLLLIENKLQPGGLLKDKKIRLGFIIGFECSSGELQAVDFSRQYFNT